MQGEDRSIAGEPQAGEVGGLCSHVNELRKGMQACRFKSGLPGTLVFHIVEPTAADNLKLALLLSPGKCRTEAQIGSKQKGNVVVLKIETGQRDVE